MFQFAGTKLADKSALEEEPESDEDEEVSSGSTAESNNEQSTANQTNGNGGGESKLFAVFFAASVKGVFSVVNSTVQLA